MVIEHVDTDQVSDASVLADAASGPSLEQWELFKDESGREWLYHCDEEWFYIDSPGLWAPYQFDSSDGAPLKWWWHSSGRWFWHPRQCQCACLSPRREEHAEIMDEYSADWTSLAGGEMDRQPIMHGRDAFEPSAKLPLLGAGMLQS